MKLIYYVIGAIVLVIIGFSISRFGCSNSDGSHTSGTEYKHDTTLVERFNVKVDTLHNTIFKNFVSSEQEPKIVYQDRVTKEFIDRTKDLHLMLGFEKSGTTLRIFAVDQNDSLLSESVYENVLNNFSAYSANNSVVVKSKLWGWNGLIAGYEQKRPVSDLKTFEHNLNLMTGVSFKDKYNLNVGTEYDITNKDLKLKAEIKVKLF